jgi:hypothetical protein
LGLNERREISRVDAILDWLPNSPYTLYALGLIVWSVPFGVCYLIAGVDAARYGPQQTWIAAPALAVVLWIAFCLLATWAALTDPDNVIYGMGVERAVGPLLFLNLGDGVLVNRAYRLRRRRQACAREVAA